MDARVFSQHIAPAFGTPAESLLYKASMAQARPAICAPCRRGRIWHAGVTCHGPCGILILDGSAHTVHVVTPLPLFLPYLPAGQSAQCVAKKSLEYLPASQSVQEVHLFNLWYSLAARCAHVARCCRHGIDILSPLTVGAVRRGRGIVCLPHTECKSLKLVHQASLHQQSLSTPLQTQTLLSCHGCQT